jgi:hypothetical protein
VPLKFWRVEEASLGRSLDSVKGHGRAGGCGLGRCRRSCSRW